MMIVLKVYQIIIMWMSKNRKTFDIWRYTLVRFKWQVDESGSFAFNKLCSTKITLKEAEGKSKTIKRPTPHKTYDWQMSNPGQVDLDLFFHLLKPFEVSVILKHLNEDSPFLFIVKNFQHSLKSLWLFWHQ